MNIVRSQTAETIEQVFWVRGLKATIEDRANENLSGELGEFLVPIESLQQTMPRLRESILRLQDAVARVTKSPTLRAERVAVFVAFAAICADVYADLEAARWAVLERQADEDTRDAATAIVSELSKVHNIGADLFKDLAASAVDYAKATGTDVPTAAKTLAKAFDDPVQRAKTLDAALETLTSTQILQIEKLTAQNDLVGAQRVLFDALTQSVGNLATNAMTPLQKATNDFGVTWERTMQSLDKSDGIKSASNAIAILVGRMDHLVGALPDLEKRWRSAFTGGLNGVVLNAIGLGDKGGPQTGGATGSWDAPAQVQAATAPVGAKAANDDAIKRALALGSAYEGVAAKIEKLTTTRKALTDAQVQSATMFGKDSAQYKKLGDEIAGVDEAIEAARKKGQGPAFHDDAGTRMLESLRQTQAALQAQLDGEGKLTEAQREQAKWQQQLADLKSKGILTADQKALLTASSQITAQLDLNVALDDEIEKRKKAADLAQRQIGFAQQVEGIERSLQSSQQSRSEQYERQLSTVGLGDRAAKEVLDQKALVKEYNDSIKKLNDDASKANADAAKTTGLTGFTDSVTKALMGDKGSSFKDLGKSIAEQVHGIVETQLTKPLAQWLQSSLASAAGGGSGSGLLSALGSLFGGGTGGGGNIGAGLTGFGGGGFADGGYTGPGDRLQPAGVVHAGEFVINKRATDAMGASGRSWLDNLNRRGYADGGYVLPMTAAIQPAASGGAGGPAAGHGITQHNHFNFSAPENRNTQNQIAREVAKAVRQATPSIRYS